MKKNFTTRRILWALAAAFLCVVYLIWATLTNMQRADIESSHVRASLDRLLLLENILVHIKSVETGERGFIISGNENSLAPYYQGLTEINRDTATLNSLGLITPQKKILIEQFFGLINVKAKQTKEIIEKRRLEGYDSAKVALQHLDEQILMKEIAAIIVQLENEDRTLLRQSNINRVQFSQQTSQKLFMLAFLFLLILAMTYYAINEEFKKVFKAEKLLKFNASLIRNISDPVITTDAFNKISNWNVYAEELYGYTEAEVLGKHPDELLQVSDKNEAFREIRDSASKKDFWKGELIHHHKTGAILHTEVTISSIIDDNLQKAGTVAVIRDITERKNAEQKIQRLTSNLEEEVKLKVGELNAIFDRITDAFIALDNDWNYTYVNKKAAELHNRPIQDLIGKNIWKEYPDVMGEHFYAALQTAKKTNEAQRQVLYYSKTGRWFEDLIYPSPDGISVYYHDITDTKNAELALEKTHEKLNYHVNNTPMGFIEFDMDLQIIQWSNRAIEIFGWTKEELLQKDDLLQTMVFKEDIEMVQQAIENLVGKKFDKGVIQIRNNTKTGRVIYCEWYNSVLKDNKGNITGVMAMVHDITIRKEIQKELIEAEAKFRNLVEQSMVGVYIMQSDKFVYVNPRLLELTGYSANELINKRSVLDLIFPEDRSVALANITQRLEGNIQSLKYELRGLKKNGEFIYVEVLGSLTQYLGKPAIIGTLIDVTERHKSDLKIQESERALKASNERFMLVAKATNDAVWDWDMINDTIWGNEIFSGLFNIPIGTEIVFKDFLDKLHLQDRQRIEVNLEMALKNKQSIVVEEFRFKIKEGAYLTFRDRANIIYDDNGKAIRMLGAMQDITEQKRNEQQILLEKDLSDSVINSLPGVFYLFNKEGKFYRWNKNIKNVSGYNDQELKNLHPLEIFDTDEKDLLRNKIANVFNNGEDFVEAHLLSKNGKKTPYYFTGMVIQYEGEPCLMGVGIDISEKLKSEQDLARSEERYRTIIEQASDGIFISDLAGRYLDVNSNGEKLSGYTKEELLKLTIYDLMSKEDIEKNPPKMDEILAGNIAINERVFKTKDGTLKEVEISAKLLTDGRFIGIVRDITARKKTEEILKSSEQKYRLLFNQNPMPMFMIELPGRNFLDVNNAAIEFYGYSKAEFLEMTGYDIRSDKDAQKLPEHDGISTAEIHNAGIWEHKKKDGSIVKVNIITHNILYEEKEARLVLANDVTEKFTAEEALKKSHEEFRQLATHLENVRETERTHIAREIHDELGQQLTGLKMDIAWLNRRLKNQEVEVKQKIAETIQLIDTTVITVRRIATELRPSILDDLGLLAAMEWQSEEFQKRSEISCFFSSNVHEVKVSADLATGIFRIYQECLTNVLRHSKATQVNSFLQIIDHILVLNIADNGKGFIAKEIATKKTLGLLGMKERTTLLGGTYEITSIPGKGTSVIISVPLKDY
jgi:PAS domain S-box-containing protein